MPYCGHFRYPTPSTILTVGSNGESQIMQIVGSNFQIDIEMQHVYEVKMKLFYTLQVIKFLPYVSNSTQSTYGRWVTKWTIRTSQPLPLRCKACDYFYMIDQQIQFEVVTICLIVYGIHMNILITFNMKRSTPNTTSLKHKQLK